MHITFEKYTSSDKQKLLEMEKQFCFHEQIKYVPEVLSTQFEEITRLNAGEILIIKADGNTAGYIAISFGYSFEFGGRLLFIDELFISEEFRGYGIASKVFVFLEEFAAKRSINAFRLEANTENEHAIDIYRKKGFVIEKRYLMTRRLNKTQ